MTSWPERSQQARVGRRAVRPVGVRGARRALRALVVARQLGEHGAQRPEHRQHGDADHDQPPAVAHRRTASVHGGGEPLAQVGGVVERRRPAAVDDAGEAHGGRVEVGRAERARHLPHRRVAPHVDRPRLVEARQRRGELQAHRLLEATGRLGRGGAPLELLRDSPSRRRARRPPSAKRALAPPRAARRSRPPARRARRPPRWRRPGRPGRRRRPRPRECCSRSREPRERAGEHAALARAVVAARPGSPRRRGVRRRRPASAAPGIRRAAPPGAHATRARRPVERAAQVDRPAVDGRDRAQARERGRDRRAPQPRAAGRSRDRRSRRRRAAAAAARANAVSRPTARRLTSRPRRPARASAPAAGCRSPPCARGGRCRARSSPRPGTAARACSRSGSRCPG